MMRLAHLVLAIVLSACGGKMPETRFYQLAEPAGQPAPGPGVPLVVEALSTDAAYDDERIVYRVTPYVITGVLLWVCVHAGGLHATLAGVLLAAFIPTRKPPDYRALALQAEANLAAEASHGGEQFRFGPSEPALRELDAIHDRLESPADRLLRNVAPR